MVRRNASGSCPARARQLIEKALRHIGIVRMTIATPQPDRNRRVGATILQTSMCKPIGQAGRPIDHERVDPVANTPRIAPREHRWTDHAMEPSQGHSGRVESSTQSMQRHGAVVVVLKVVGARPDHLHRTLEPL
jgi:hypothetical protein